MQSNILDFISQQYNTMTRSSKKLADYIFTNKSMVQYMSITSWRKPAAFPRPRSPASAGGWGWRATMSSSSP